MLEAGKALSKAGSDLALGRSELRIRRHDLLPRHRGALCGNGDRHISSHVDDTRSPVPETGARGGRGTFAHPPAFPFRLLCRISLRRCAGHKGGGTLSIFGVFCAGSPCAERGRETGFLPSTKTSRGTVIDVRLPELPLWLLLLLSLLLTMLLTMLMLMLSSCSRLLFLLFIYTRRCVRKPEDR